MPEPTDAYLSVIDWPDTLDAESRAHALVRSAGLDLFTARLRIARGTPQVVARLPEARARGGVDVLHRAGATAFAPTRAQIAGMNEPLRAKRLTPAEGAPEPMFMVEAWRGEGRGMLARDIFLLVRARLKRSRTRVTDGPASSGLSGRTIAITAVAGPAAGMVASVFGAGRSGADTTTSLHVTEVLDIHLRDGAIVRIDGDKFSFDILGPAKSPTDRQNMDRLALLLANAAPAAMVDTSFAAFTCPPEIARDSWIGTSGSTVHSRDEGPAFDFYSCWVSLMYRSLLVR